MGERFGLRYHHKTFELLGRPPRFGTVIPIWLDILERRIGRPLPASVREWYSIIDGADILGEFSNSDHPVALEDLGRPRPVRGYGEIDPVADGLLLILIENQSCCYWLVGLEGDDPPVYIAERLTSDPATWQRSAERFSDFTLAKVWAFGKTWQGRAGSFFTLDRTLSRFDVAFLRAAFVEEGPRTGLWAGSKDHLFRTGDGFVWVEDFPIQSQWHIGSDTPEGLETAVRTVWGSGTLLAREPGATGGESEEQAEELLERLHGETPLPRLRAEEPPLSPPDLDFLIEHFTESKRVAGEDGVSAHIFDGPGCRIRIASDAWDRDGGESVWVLEADGEEELMRLARRVWNCGRLRETLDSAHPVGRRVLELLRHPDPF